MTCTDQQVEILMKERKKYSQETAAAKAGMSPKTARKYLKSKIRPSNSKIKHDWLTRPDIFTPVWPEIAAMLEATPALEAKTLMAWLTERQPESFQEKHLRTLQRRLKQWRARFGPDKQVIFPQEKIPGKQSQSDYTEMKSLNITIAGELFDHLLFHFMLPYSRWEAVSICFSESFDSLTAGYEQAVWDLGGVTAEHRTDNLSAATHRLGHKRAFNESWQQFLAHFSVKPSANNPGESHENGSVEKSHDLIKNAIDQQLMLRGSRDFYSREAYTLFLNKVVLIRNAGRQQAVAHELKHLQSLPKQSWNAPNIILVRVSPFSTIRVFKGVYSVPSRLIGETIKAYVYSSYLEIYYGDKLIGRMPRLPASGGTAINYRHIVAQLMRKPGAFLQYKFREDLFPRLIFKQAYEVLIEASAHRGHKDYLSILHYAALENEEEVALALFLLLENEQIPTLKEIKQMVQAKKAPPLVSVIQPQLYVYDRLLQEVRYGS